MKIIIGQNKLNHKFFVSVAVVTVIVGVDTWAVDLIKKLCDDHLVSL